MFRNGKASAVIVLCCIAAGPVLAGCEEGPETGLNRPAGVSTDSGATELADDDASFTGTRSIEVDGRSVNVACSGAPAQDRPVIVLMHGGGDGLEKMAGLQKTLSEKDRVCSYDRLGAGASDQPNGPRTLESSGNVLTGVLDRVSGDSPVVLAGHSLGGLLAARYAPDHQDRVAGLVLMDATSPTQIADLNAEIPASATGMAAELRAQTLAIFRGESPEKLVIQDGEVRPAGNIPVEVIQHGQPYLAAVPEYGPGLERAWSEGQHKWLALSGRSTLSTAPNSGHYIYLDRPDVAVQAIQRVAGQAADSE